MSSTEIIGGTAAACSATAGTPDPAVLDAPALAVTQSGLSAAGTALRAACPKKHGAAMMTSPLLAVVDVLTAAVAWCTPAMAAGAAGVVFSAGKPVADSLVLASTVYLKFGRRASLEQRSEQLLEKRSGKRAKKRLGRTLGQRFGQRLEQRFGSPSVGQRFGQRLEQRFGSPSVAQRFGQRLEQRFGSPSEHLLERWLARHCA